MFLILLPYPMITVVSWFWVWLLCLPVWLVIFTLSYCVSAFSVWLWHCTCLCCLFLPFLLHYIDNFYGAAWKDQWVYLVCLLLVSGWLFPSHYGDNLLQVCWWALLVPSFLWLCGLLLVTLLWNFKHCYNNGKFGWAWMYINCKYQVYT